MKRREFLKVSAIASAGIMTAGKAGLLMGSTNPTPQVVQVTNGEPAALFDTAINAFGGIGAFISNGDVVVVKPNIGWDRAPQFAANTNPELVKTVIQACLDAGAAKVKVFDKTCNNPRRCYTNSKIEETAKAAGADVSNVRDFRFKSMRLPEGEIIKEWPIYKDYLEADKVINLPIAKHHSMAMVTMGMKNLMGVMGGNRGEIHNHFEKKLIDIDSHILPTLTIIDAYRILLRNGPVGGNLNDVKLAKTLIMSPCTVSADFVGLNLFGHSLEQISYLKEAYSRGINKYPRESLKIQTINLS